jgi:hypothetical protein
MITEEIGAAEKAEMLYYGDEIVSSINANYLDGVL